MTADPHGLAAVAALVLWLLTRATRAVGVGVVGAAAMVGVCALSSLWGCTWRPR
jgi:hypothetical protein